MCVCVCYRVEEHSEEELAPPDALVQLLGPPGVLVVEDGVCEQTARLAGQHLHTHTHTHTHLAQGATTSF